MRGGDAPDGSLHHLVGRGGTHGTEGGQTNLVHGLGAFLYVVAFTLFAIGQELAHTACTLDDGTTDEGFRERRSYEILDAGTSGTLTHYGDARRVAAELCDVLAHPLQGLDLVGQTIVARHVVFALGRECFVRQEAEDAKAVVDGDEDDTTLGPCIAIHGTGEAVAAHVGSAVYPHHDGQLGLGMTDGGFGCPHVEVEAVLGAGPGIVPVEFLTVERGGILLTLRRDVAPGVGHLDALPGFDGLRQLPAKFANGRGSVGDATEERYARLMTVDALHLTAFDLDDGSLGTCCRAEQQQDGDEQIAHSFRFFDLRIMQTIYFQRAFCSIRGLTFSSS